MLVLRATAKVLRYLPDPVEPQEASDTALGDWYANRFVFDRRPLLLLVSAESLLAVLVPARDVRGLPGRLATVVAERLERLGAARALIDAETRAMADVVVARTRSRSVLGSMNDFVRTVPIYLDPRYGDDTSLHDAERRLARTPCGVTGRVGDAFYPGERAVALLRSRWGGDAG